MNVAELFIQQARERPDAAAIIEPLRGVSRTITSAELDDASARGAALLRSAGLEPGQRVLVLVPMSIELYVILTALLRAGLVATFIDPSAGRAHLDAGCEAVQPDAFVGSAKAHLLRLISPGLRRVRRKFVVGGRVCPGAVRWSDLYDQSPQAELATRDGDAPALITFTSGSTATPKAAARTHGFLLAQHEALAEAIDLQPGQVDLTTLPIFALANLAAGVTTLLPDADLRRVGCIAAGPVIEQIRRHRPTRAAASPAFFERLVEHCERTGERLESLEQLYTGGAPVFPDLLDRLGNVAPRATATAVYGSTEAEPIAHLAAHDITAADRDAMLGGAGLLAGRPVEQVELRIVAVAPQQPGGPLSEQAFAAACLPAEQAGEIVVHGRHVLSGYLNPAHDSETKFRVGERVWHRTGDAGYLDAAGRLWLLGRAAEAVVDDRGRLYPFAVECAARAIPGVARAALVGLNGRRLLVIEAASTASGDLPDRIHHALPWARLDQVVPVRRLPLDRRHNAKIDYPALRRLLRHRR